MSKAVDIVSILSREDHVTRLHLLCSDIEGALFRIASKACSDVVWKYGGFDCGKDIDEILVA